MKKVLIPVIAVISLGISGLALAGTTSIGIGYDNVAVNLGHGVSSSVPAGKLTVDHTFSGGYGVGFGLVDGAGNGMTYRHLQLSADKKLPFAGGCISPEVMMGDSNAGVGNAYHVSTAYAGFGAAYSYPINRYVSLGIDAAMGRDFSTHVTGLRTVGGWLLAI
jgi:hypothetical protein